MNVTNAVRERVAKKLKECVGIFEAHYGVKFKRFPTVSYDLKGTTAGTANYVSWHIRLNPVLLMENVEDFLTRTVPHEFAHLACDQLYPEAHRPNGAGFRMYGARQKREVHGPKWQSIMRVLGADPSRCHSYDVANVKGKKASFTYQCTRCNNTFSLGPQRHAKLQRNPRAYTCKCRGELKLLVNRAPAPAAKPAAKQPEVKMPAAGTKQDRALALFKQYQSLYNRTQMIYVFVNELDMTPAGASTYYYNCVKLYNAGI